MKNIKIHALILVLKFCWTGFGQEMKVSGTIKTLTGVMCGANITVKGTKIITQSDFDGTYSIKANKGDILVFSYIFCKSVEKKIADSEIMNIVLIEELHELIGCTFGYTGENYEEWQNNKQIKTYPLTIDKTSSFDLENNFKNDVKNKTLNIYLLDNNSQEISESEFNFQNRYQVKFASFDSKNHEYFEAYNKKTFDYLEDNFNDKWQNEINDDVLSFLEWQNN